MRVRACEEADKIRYKVLIFLVSHGVYPGGCPPLSNWPISSPDPYICFLSRNGLATA